jgi:hypothetical protein
LLGFLLSHRLINQIEDAGVLAEPHLAGAAVAKALTVIGGHLDRLQR